MCGILGLLLDNKNYLNKLEFSKSLNSLYHRGPDNSDFFDIQLSDKFLRFGHTRLSIIDVSSNSNQPMKDKNGNVIIFNGEIYNHLSLRKELNNTNFKTSSDTETLLFLLNESKNYTYTLNKINGMFSFCYYNKSKNTILIARDRVGEKPLYFFIDNNIFCIASDLKAIKLLNKEKLQLNLNSIEDYFSFNYIPAPKTIYKNCYKLPQASFIEINLNKFELSSLNKFEEINYIKGLTYKKWWRLETNPKSKKIINSFSEVKENMKYFLKKSVKEQLISDVPIGAFLSSGIDSSLIVSIMSKYISNLNTFTIGYDFSEYDESIDAKSISNFLGCEHNSYKLTKSELINSIQNTNDIFSEPFADSSQIPTFLVSKLAKKKVKVALSGDGGDELFGGYNRYLYAHKYWKYYNLIPKSFFRILKINSFKSFILQMIRNPKLHKIIQKISYIKDEKSYYLSMVKQYENITDLISIPSNKDDKFNEYFKINEIPFEEKMMLADFNTYLPDDILCKVDRASMHNSLECRAPYLSKDIIEYAFMISMDYKISRGNSKYILKEILKEYLPMNLISSEKKGFALPIAYWMKNDLKDWVNDIICTENIKKHEFLNKNLILKLKNEHFNSNVNHEHKLWAIIQFFQWYRQN